MIDIDPALERMLAVGDLRDRYGVTEQQAEALLDEFGSVEAVASAGHEELLEVHGIGPMTADDITPKSVRMRWIREMAADGALIPTYIDDDGYIRHWSERDKHPKASYESDDL